MKKLAMAMIAAALLAGCGTTPGDRTLSGAGIGAGIGLLAGPPGVLVGAHLGHPERRQLPHGDVTVVAVPAGAGIVHDREDHDAPVRLTRAAAEDPRDLAGRPGFRPRLGPDSLLRAGARIVVGQGLGEQVSIFPVQALPVARV